MSKHPLTCLGLSLSDYCADLIQLGRSRIPESDPGGYILPHQGSVQDHKTLLADSQRVIEQLIQVPAIQKASPPTLSHYDLHKRNIFVSDTDPTIVTGIIDWQSTSVEPGFVYANEIPDFTTSLPDESELLALGAGHDEEGKIAASNLKSRKDLGDSEICTKTYEVILKGLAPKLGLGRALDETLLRPIRYAATSWRDSATAVRQELVDLAERWSSDLGLPGTCPYQPSPKQLEDHRKRYEDFESAQKLKLWLTGMLQSSSDGWVPNDVWDTAREANKDSFGLRMQSVRESKEMDDQKARELWPFDEMGD